MIIKTCFIKVMFHSINNGTRQLAGLLARKYDCDKVTSAKNSHLVTPTGSSIYGVLISSDTARQWL
jgi:hypothetical protein